MSSLICILCHNRFAEGTSSMLLALACISGKIIWIFRSIDHSYYHLLLSYRMMTIAPSTKLENILSINIHEKLITQINKKCSLIP